MSNPVTPLGGLLQELNHGRSVLDEALLAAAKSNAEVEACRERVNNAQRAIDAEIEALKANAPAFTHWWAVHRTGKCPA